MLEKILKFSIHQRWMILIASLGVAALGVYNFQRLPIDAVPDITNIQVQINTEAPGYSPLETEQRITYLIETAMFGLTKLKQIRSISKYGLSQVTVIFHDGTDIYFARQLINERIQSVKAQLPQSIEPMMGPIVTGLGEIYMWTVETKPNALKAYTSTELRTIQDWVIRPQLLTVPGVAEINAIGGYTKQFHVTPYPDKLKEYGITFRDILRALAENNDNVGAGYIEHKGEQYLIRAPGQVKTLEEIRWIRLGSYNGTPIYIKHVADVVLGKELRTGAATKNGKETVLGTVMMLTGENTRTVARSVAEKMKQVNESLPEGVVAKTVYDRTVLVNATIATVEKNLMEGAILVIVILFLFLGNIRAAFITALVIPISMLFAMTGMVTYKISGNLLSLGAIDFGIIVDGAVIIVENCISRLAEAQKERGRILTRSERMTIVFEASREVRKATMFGELIITIVYLPILTLTGIEGKMFYPMAFTVIAALLGAMILSMTFVPAMIALLITGKVSEKENIIIKWCKKGYRPVFHFVMGYKTLTITATGILIVLSVLVTSRMGMEFLPNLDEGDIAVQALRITETSLKQSIEMQSELEQKIDEFPEVAGVFAKIGTAEIASDPMSPNIADIFVRMKPHSEWPDPDRLKSDFLKELESGLKKIPGNNYVFTQPIQMRFNELMTGVRADIAVKIFGDDMDVLRSKAKEIASVLKTVPGAKDVSEEQTFGLPVANIKIKRKKLARYGLDMADVQNIIEIAIGGKKAGLIFEGDRRFDLVVRLPESVRQDLKSLKEIPIPLPKQDVRPGLDLPSSAMTRYPHIPLGDIADFDIAPGPNQISRENGKRRVVVSANVRGRDIGTFVDEADKLIKDKVKIPAGYWTTWGGQFENLISAAKRLQLVIPIALILVFLLLFTSFGRGKDALLVFTGIPLALTGGIFALWIRDIPLSISAAIGFIALSGIAVLNGLVMISFINKLRLDGHSIDEAIEIGSISRLRPVLMTALVASLGFLPMALSTSTGAEVQRPLATVVIGGLVTSTLLTLLVLPVLYKGFKIDPLKDQVSEDGDI